MLTLSGALSTALGAPVQQPALLVQIGFSTPVRWSSFGPVSWNGFSWLQKDLALDGLAVDALRVRGTLNVGNADDVIGALVLSEGTADVPITIYGYDAAATALADVVQLCQAVGGASRIGPRSVSIALRAPSEFLLSPRTFVGAAAGFTSLLPAGTVLKINGIDYRMGGR